MSNANKNAKSDNADNTPPAAPALKHPGAILTAKVAQKGGVSVYGVQRHPVTLYREQWEMLLERAPAILAFIEANKDKLATKATAATVDGRVAL